MVLWLKTITGICLLLTPGFIGAQEKFETPSQKTKEAVDKLLRAPSVIGKSLQDLSNAAKAKLQGAVAQTQPMRATSDGNAEQKSEAQAPVNFSTAGKRDPFRPFNLNTRSHNRREHLSPLERYDLGQLRLVGIIWDVKEPRAMVEDGTGLGYIVKVGTPIGTNDGKVRAIKPNEIIIEETHVDLFGGKKKREVNIKLSVEKAE
ncbi:MAG TPA: pilus assembly protein PilP [Candidatus Binatia bacterium]|nr:pilus assembly protein PilP [Candidatus Binatia bacterium]